MRMLAVHFTMNRATLAFIALIPAVAMANAQPRQPSNVPALLPDVAMLFHGAYGEESYKLTSTMEGAVTLEELGARGLRLRVRQLPDKECVFVSTRDTGNGVDVAQLDFTKFDGTYQLWEACGPAGTLLEKQCTYSLHFSSPQAYCHAMFSQANFDLNNIPFPNGTCVSYALGAREKKFYAKDIDAFERIRKQCAGGR
jgi:hypothetical protein